MGVLRGMSDTLGRSRPVLMIERSDRFEQVADLLGGNGYRAFAYDADSKEFRVYRDQQTVNVFFLPDGDEGAVKAEPARR